MRNLMEDIITLRAFPIIVDAISGVFLLSQFL